MPVNGQDTAHPYVLAAYPGETVWIEPSPASSGSRLLSLHNRSNVHVERIGFRNNQRNGATGVDISGSGGNIVVTGCTFEHIDCYPGTLDSAGLNDRSYAIVVDADSTSAMHNVRIDSCVVRNCTVGYGAGILVAGNVNGYQITNCDVSGITHTGIHAAGGMHPNLFMTVDRPKHGRIEGNRVWGCVSPRATPVAAGIFLDGCYFATASRNRVWGNQYGIALGADSPNVQCTTVAAACNLIYQNQQAGLVMGGTTSTNGGLLDSAIAVNNTLFENDSLMTGQGEFYQRGVSGGCAFANNLVQANAQQKVIGTDPLQNIQPVFCDYNLYWGPNGSSSLIFETYGSTFTGFLQYQAAFRDAHGAGKNPMFVNMAGMDFRLAPNSYAINHGSNQFLLPGLRDFDGNARIYNGVVDMGAYESSLIINGIGSTAGRASFACFIAGDALQVQGVAANAPVRVYDALGRELASQQSDALGRCTIAMPLMTGLLVVQCGVDAVKVVR